MKKRLFSLLLCYVMVLMLLPFTVFATTEISTIALTGFMEPVAGKPCENYLVLTTSTPGVSFYGIDWLDKTADRFLDGNETFQTGHIYQVQIWMEAKDGYSFKCVNDYTPAITATLDGKTLKVAKAFEYKAYAMVVLIYEFPAIGSSNNPAESHVHTPSDWRITGAYHYKACTTCGDFLEQEDHKGGKATCVDKGICTVCGYEYLETTEEHIPDTSKWIARAEMYHFHACKLCGAHCDIEDHKWSPRYHPVDASGHAYQCADCKGYDKIKPHNPGPAATETSPQTCKDCGYIITPVQKHTHTLTLVAEVAPTCTESGMNAYYICSGCNLKSWDAAGKDVIADGKDLTIPPQGHHISNGWGFDAQTHWRICAVCEARMIETDMAHDLQDGKCTTCEYVSPAPTETAPPETAPTETAPPEPTPSETASVGSSPTEASRKPAKPHKTAEAEYEDGLPWWAFLLIGFAATGAGICGGVLVIGLTKKKKRT